MVIRRKVKKGEDLKKVAKNMLGANDKEGYYLGDLVIKNLSELVEHLERFTEQEAHWVASWIEYLGDSTCAKKIRKSPAKFKDILRKRHKELSKNA